MTRYVQSKYNALASANASSFFLRIFSFNNRNSSSNRSCSFCAISHALFALSHIFHAAAISESLGILSYSPLSLSNFSFSSAILFSNAIISADKIANLLRHSSILNKRVFCLALIPIYCAVYCPVSVPYKTPTW